MNEQEGEARKGRRGFRGNNNFAINKEIMAKNSEEIIAINSRGNNCN